MNNVDVSLIIPTYRNHDDFLKKTVDSLDLCDKKGYSYEILVSSPFEEVRKYDNTKFFKDNKNNGSIGPINYLANVSSGNFICVLVDDYTPSENLFDVFNFLQSDKFIDRKYKVTSLSLTLPSGIQKAAELTPPSVINPRTNEEEFHTTRQHILKFPVMDRKSYEYLERHIFHPHFLHHCADNYLSIYLGYVGEPTIEFRNAWMHDWATDNSDPKYDVHDTLVMHNICKYLKKQDPLDAKYIGNIEKISNDKLYNYYRNLDLK